MHVEPGPSPAREWLRGPMFKVVEFRRQQRLELALGLLAITVLIGLLMPIEFADDLSLAVGPNTNEGVFASFVALGVVAICAVAVLRRFTIPAALLIGLAVILAAATFQIADLMTDMSGSCPRDPVDYYEPDLAEDLQDSSTCFTDAGFNLVPLAWGSLLVSSALALAAILWRRRWRRAAGAAFLGIAIFLYIGSALAGLQHLE